MKLRNKHSVLIIFFFFFLSIQIIIFCPISIRAEDDEYLITWDWLNAKVYDDPYDSLRHSIGGYDLTEFQNLGYQQNDEGIIFKSKATFGFEIDSFLVLNVEKCYPDVNFNAIKKFNYLGVAYTWGIVPQHAETYFITARSVDLGETFNDQHYTDPLQLTVDIVPTFKDFGGQYLNGVLINTVEHIYEIKAVKLSEVEHGLVGEYNDYYTDQSTKSGNVDVIKLETDDPGNAAAREGINDLNLGWETDDVLDVRDGLTIQNGNWMSDTVGTLDMNSGTGAFNFNVNFALRPEITYSEQTIHVRGACLIVDTLFNTYQVHGAVTNYNDVRTRSIHVTAPFIHQEFEVTVYFLATVNLDAELHESALSDPYFVRGDWLWNEEIGGTTDMTLVESNPLDYILDTLMPLIMFIVIVIIIILVIYVFMKVGVPLLMFRMGLKYG